MFVNLSLILLLFGSRYRLPPAPPHIHSGRDCPRINPYDTDLQEIATSGTWYVNRVTATSTKLLPYACMKASFDVDPANDHGVSLSFHGLLNYTIVETSTVTITKDESRFEGLFEIDPKIQYNDLKASSIINYIQVDDNEHLMIYACFYLPESHRFCHGAMILSRHPKLSLREYQKLENDLARRQEFPVFMRHIFQNHFCGSLDHELPAPKLRVRKATPSVKADASNQTATRVSKDAKVTKLTSRRTMNTESEETKHNDEENKGKEGEHSGEEGQSRTEPTALPTPQPIICPYLQSLTTPKPSAKEITTQPASRNLEFISPPKIISPPVPHNSTSLPAPADAGTRRTLLNGKKRRWDSTRLKDNGSFARKSIPLRQKYEIQSGMPEPETVPQATSTTKIDDSLLSNAKKRNAHPDLIKDSNIFENMQSIPNYDEYQSVERKQKPPATGFRDADLYGDDQPSSKYSTADETEGRSDDSSEEENADLGQGSPSGRFRGRTEEIKRDHPQGKQPSLFIGDNTNDSSPNANKRKNYQTVLGDLDNHANKQHNAPRIATDQAGAKNAKRRESERPGDLIETSNNNRLVPAKKPAFRIIKTKAPKHKKNRRYWIKDTAPAVQLPNLEFRSMKNNYNSNTPKDKKRKSNPLTVHKSASTNDTYVSPSRVNRSRARNPTSSTNRPFDDSKYIRNYPYKTKKNKETPTDLPISTTSDRSLKNKNSKKKPGFRFMTKAGNRKPTHSESTMALSKPLSENGTSKRLARNKQNLSTGKKRRKKIGSFVSNNKPSSSPNKNDQLKQWNEKTTPTEKRTGIKRPSVTRGISSLLSDAKKRRKQPHNFKNKNIFATTSPSPNADEMEKPGEEITISNTPSSNQRAKSQLQPSVRQNIKDLLSNAKKRRKSPNNFKSNNIFVTTSPSTQADNVDKTPVVKKMRNSKKQPAVRQNINQLLSNAKKLHNPHEFQKNYNSSIPPFSSADNEDKTPLHATTGNSEEQPAVIQTITQLLSDAKGLRNPYEFEKNNHYSISPFPSEDNMNKTRNSQKLPAVRQKQNQLLSNTKKRQKNPNNLKNNIFVAASPPPDAVTMGKPVEDGVSDKIPFANKRRNSKKQPTVRKNANQFSNSKKRQKEPNDFKTKNIFIKKSSSSNAKKREKPIKEIMSSNKPSGNKRQNSESQPAVTENINQLLSNAKKLRNPIEFVKHNVSTLHFSSADKPDKTSLPDIIRNFENKPRVKQSLNQLLSNAKKRRNPYEFEKYNNYSSSPLPSADNMHKPPPPNKRRNSEKQSAVRKNANQLLTNVKKRRKHPNNVKNNNESTTTSTSSNADKLSKPVEEIMSSKTPSGEKTDSSQMRPAGKLNLHQLLSNAKKRRKQPNDFRNKNIFAKSLLSLSVDNTHGKSVEENLVIPARAKTLQQNNVNKPTVVNNNVREMLEAAKKRRNDPRAFRKKGLFPKLIAKKLTQGMTERPDEHEKVSRAILHPELYIFTPAIVQLHPHPEKDMTIHQNSDNHLPNSQDMHWGQSLGHGPPRTQMSQSDSVGNRKNSHYFRVTGGLDPRKLDGSSKSGQITPVLAAKNVSQSMQRNITEDDKSVKKKISPLKRTGITPIRKNIEGSSETKHGQQIDTDTTAKQLQNKIHSIQSAPLLNTSLDLHDTSNLSRNIKNKPWNKSQRRKSNTNKYQEIPRNTNKIRDIDKSKARQITPANVSTPTTAATAPKIKEARIGISIPRATATLSPTSQEKKLISPRKITSPTSLLAKRLSQARPARKWVANSFLPKSPAVKEFYYRLLGEPNNHNSHAEELSEKPSTKHIPDTYERDVTASATGEQEKTQLMHLKPPRDVRRKPGKKDDTNGKPKSRLSKTRPQNDQRDKPRMVKTKLLSSESKPSGNETPKLAHMKTPERKGYYDGALPLTNSRQMKLSSVNMLPTPGRVRQSSNNRNMGAKVKQTEENQQEKNKLRQMKSVVINPNKLSIVIQPTNVFVLATPPRKNNLSNVFRPPDKIRKQQMKQTINDNKKNAKGMPISIQPDSKSKAIQLHFLKELALEPLKPLPMRHTSNAGLPVPVPMALSTTPNSKSRYGKPNQQSVARPLTNLPETGNNIFRVVGTPNRTQPEEGLALPKLDFIAPYDAKHKLQKQNLYDIKAQPKSKLTTQGLKGKPSSVNMPNKGKQNKNNPAGSKPQKQNLYITKAQPISKPIATQDLKVQPSSLKVPNTGKQNKWNPSGSWRPEYSNSYDPDMANSYNQAPKVNSLTSFPNPAKLKQALRKPVLKSAAKESYLNNLLRTPPPIINQKSPAKVFYYTLPRQPSPIQKETIQVEPGLTMLLAAIHIPHSVTKPIITSDHEQSHILNQKQVIGDNAHKPAKITKLQDKNYTSSLEQPNSYQNDLRKQQAQVDHSIHTDCCNNVTIFPFSPFKVIANKLRQNTFFRKSVNTTATPNTPPTRPTESTRKPYHYTAFELFRRKRKKAAQAKRPQNSSSVASTQLNTENSKPVPVNSSKSLNETITNPYTKRIAPEFNRAKKMIKSKMHYLGSKPWQLKTKLSTRIPNQRFKQKQQTNAMEPISQFKIPGQTTSYNRFSIPSRPKNKNFSVSFVSVKNSAPLPTKTKTSGKIISPKGSYYYTISSYSKFSDNPPETELKSAMYSPNVSFTRPFLDKAKHKESLGNFPPLPPRPPLPSLPSLPLHLPLPSFPSLPSPPSVIPLSHQKPFGYTKQPNSKLGFGYSDPEHPIHHILKSDGISRKDKMAAAKQAISPTAIFNKHIRENYGPSEYGETNMFPSSTHFQPFADLDVNYGIKPIFGTNDYDYENKPFKTVDGDFVNKHPFTKMDAQFPPDESSEKLEGNILAAEHNIDDLLHPTTKIIPVYGKIKVQTQKHHHFGGLHTDPRKKQHMDAMGNYPSYAHLHEWNSKQEPIAFVPPEKPSFRVEGKRYKYN